MSNMIRSGNKVQGLWNHSINNKDFINELENTYHAFLISNYGPNNGLTLIRNSAGCDFLTSSSSTILQQLPFFHPCFKFINALINAQLKAYGVHGLYVGSLCSGLLFRSLKLEDDVSHRIVKDVSDWIQQSFIEKLYAEIQRITFKIDIGKLNQLLCVVRGILYSKAGYALTVSENEHIAVNIVEAFLKTIPDGNQSDFGRVTVSTLEGPSSVHSCIRNGLLYRLPDFSLEELQLRLETLPRENLKVIIFTVPLSHDVREKQLVEWHSNSSLEHSFADHLFKSLSTSLKRKGVNVIASQKFIDAALKYDLEKYGFLVLERLGTTSTDSLVAMTGARPVSDLSQTQHLAWDDDHVGSISSLEATTIQGKTYLCIHAPATSQQRDVTFVLAGINCHVVEFLKESVDTSVSLLRRMIREDRVVVGAGCLESFCAVVLTQLKAESSLTLSEEMDASPSKIGMVFDVYIETFLRLSLIPSGGKWGKLVDYCVDSTWHHLWHWAEALDAEDGTSNPDFVQARCACKRFSKSELSSSSTRLIPGVSLTKRELGQSEIFGRGESNQEMKAGKSPSFDDCVLDYWPAKMNAIRFALDGAAELLRIGTCIFDR